LCPGATELNPKPTFSSLPHFEVVRFLELISTKHFFEPLISPCRLIAE